MWKDLSEYIHRKANSSKVIEIGVGNFFDVYNYLKEYDDIELVLVDIKPQKDFILKDDIFSPDLKIYEGVKLIYSIRPPYELHRRLIEIAKEFNSKLIIKPYPDEALDKNTGMKIKNFKKASFYELNI